MQCEKPGCVGVARTTSLDEWDAYFSLRDKSTFRPTSLSCRHYNCIAWAAGDSKRRWEHQAGYKWPKAPRTEDIESLVAVFAGLGYSKCDDGSLEAGFEKVVLYVHFLRPRWTHAARQLPNGMWTSKIGHLEDVQHRTPECLQSGDYGRVHSYMRRATSPAIEPG